MGGSQGQDGLHTETASESAWRNSLESRLNLVLQQGARKPFEPGCEMLQIKMNMVFVSFFVAVMPYGTIGALVTLFAKWLEVKANLSKMVFVRRRVFAGSDRAMRRTQIAFAVALAAVVPAWSTLLSLVTFNERLYEWGDDENAAIGAQGYVFSHEPKYMIVRLVLMWMTTVVMLFVTSGMRWLGWRRWAAIVVLLVPLWFYMNPQSHAGAD